MQPTFNFNKPRLQFLALLCSLAFVAGGGALALGTPENLIATKEIPANPRFQSGLLASPSAKYQVSSSASQTRVTVSSGGLLIRAQGQRYDILTPDGTVSVTDGEAIVLAQDGRVKVEVVKGTARVDSPYLVAGSGEVLSPATLAAGESAQGSLIGPEEAAALENLGMHESAGPLADLEMADPPEPLGELAMAEFGTIITSLGLSETAVASIAAPVLGGATAAAGAAGLANRLNRAGPPDGVPPVSP